jgi:hypothetical protein
MRQFLFAVAMAVLILGGAFTLVWAHDQEHYKDVVLAGELTQGDDLWVKEGQWTEKIEVHYEMPPAEDGNPQRYTVTSVWREYLVRTKPWRGYRAAYVSAVRDEYVEIIWK